MNIQVKKEDYARMAQAWKELGKPKDLEHVFLPLLKGAARVRRAKANLEKRKSRKPRENIQRIGVRTKINFLYRIPKIRKRGRKHCSVGLLMQGRTFGIEPLHESSGAQACIPIIVEDHLGRGHYRTWSIMKMVVEAMVRHASDEILLVAR